MFSLRYLLLCIWILFPTFKVVATTLPNTELRELGTAYLSRNGITPQTVCVNGTKKTGLTGGAHLEYKLDGNYEDILRTITGSLAIGVEIPVLGSIEGMASLAWQHASTKNTASWNYIFQAQSHSDVLEQGSERVSEEVNRRIANDVTLDLYEICGDEYISRIDYGASLIVSLVVEFFKTADKTEVEGKLRANFSLGVLAAKGEGSLGLDFRSMNDRVKVHVVADQFGGDHGALTTLLKGKIVDCSLEKFDQCIETIREIIRYANTDFAEQIKNDAGRYGVLRYHTTPYRHNLALSRLTSKQDDIVAPAVWAERQNLMSESEVNRELFARAIRLLSQWKGHLVQNNLFEKIKDFKNKVLRNLRHISREISTCFRFPEQCLELTHTREELDERLLDLTDAMTPQDMLFDAAKKGDVKRVFAAIQVRAANPLLTTVDGSNALHLAAQYGNTNVILHLLREKSELLETVNEEGQTALCIAAVNGHENAVANLIKIGANRELECAVSVGVGGRLRLSLKNAAAYLGHSHVLNELLLHDGGITDSQKRTVLHWAAAGGHVEMLKYLLSRGQSLFSRDSSGFTPRDIAAKMHQTPAREFLEEKAQQELLGKTSLDENELRQLFAAGAKLEGVNADGQTIIHIIARGGDASNLEALRRIGANVDVRNSQGNTPLHEAASRNEPDIVAKLLQLGAKIDAQNHNGQTPLHSALMRSANAAAYLLLQAGASITLTDFAGQDAADIAKDYDSSLAELLSRASWSKDEI